MLKFVKANKIPLKNKYITKLNQTHTRTHAHTHTYTHTHIKTTTLIHICKRLEKPIHRKVIPAKVGRVYRNILFSQHL